MVDFCLGSASNEVFAQLLAVVAQRGVKLLLLSGTSDDKQRFVQDCIGQMDVVKLGAELVPKIKDVSGDSIACVTQNYLSDLHENEPLCVDEIEVLFDPEMDINVLSVLKYASRTRPLVVNWPGQLDDSDKLLYFARGDTQQKSYRLDSEVVVFDESGIVYPEAILR